MSPFSAFAFRLHANQDLKQEIQSVVEREKITAGCILSSVGSLTQAVVRFAGQTGATTLSGDLEILSLNGTVGVEGSHLHLCVADGNGQVIGGHLLDGCLIRTTAEIVIVSLPEMRFGRERDPATGYRELVITDARSPAPQAPKPPTPNTQHPTPKTPSPALHILHTDGASKGNPGPAGIGIALFKADEMQSPVFAIGEPIPDTTNNVAEYQALLRGLQEALLRGVERIEVRTDSQLMAQQVAGKYKVSAPQIVPLHTEARKLLARFAQAKVIYVPREQNSLADKLANQGVDAGKARR